MITYALYIGFKDEKKYDKNLLDLLTQYNIYLTPTEYKFFNFLYINKNMICTPHLIMDNVWGNFAVEYSVIRNYIKLIRKKTKNTPFENAIVTKKGFGYKFILPPDTATGVSS